MYQSFQSTVLFFLISLLMTGCSLQGGKINFGSKDKSSGKQNFDFNWLQDAGCSDSAADNYKTVQGQEKREYCSYSVSSADQKNRTEKYKRVLKGLSAKKGRVGHISIGATGKKVVAKIDSSMKTMSIGTLNNEEMEIDKSEIVPYWMYDYENINSSSGRTTVCNSETNVYAIKAEEVLAYVRANYDSSISETQPEMILSLAQEDYAVPQWGSLQLSADNRNIFYLKNCVSSNIPLTDKVKYRLSGLHEGVDFIVNGYISFTGTVDQLQLATFDKNNIFKDQAGMIEVNNWGLCDGKNITNGNSSPFGFSSKKCNDVPYFSSSPGCGTAAGPKFTFSVVVGQQEPADSFSCVFFESFNKKVAGTDVPVQVFAHSTFSKRREIVCSNSSPGISLGKFDVTGSNGAKAISIGQTDEVDCIENGVNYTYTLSPSTVDVQPSSFIEGGSFGKFFYQASSNSIIYQHNIPQAELNAYNVVAARFAMDTTDENGERARISFPVKISVKGKIEVTEENYDLNIGNTDQTKGNVLPLSELPYPSTKSSAFTCNLQDAQGNILGLVNSTPAGFKMNIASNLAGETSIVVTTSGSGHIGGKKYSFLNSLSCNDKIGFPTKKFIYTVTTTYGSAQRETIDIQLPTWDIADIGSKSKFILDSYLKNASDPILKEAYVQLKGPSNVSADISGSTDNSGIMNLIGVLQPIPRDYKVTIQSNSTAEANLVLILTSANANYPIYKFTLPIKVTIDSNGGSTAGQVLEAPSIQITPNPGGSKPQIKVSGSNVSGNNVQIFDGECGNLSKLIASGTANSQSLTLTPSNDLAVGAHSIKGRICNAASACSACESFAYTVQNSGGSTVNAPTALDLQNIVSPGLEAYIGIKVTGTDIKGKNIKLYKGSTCNQLLNSATASTNTVYMGTGELSIGEHIFTAKACLASGTCSPCSTANVSYVRIEDNAEGITCMTAPSEGGSCGEVIKVYVKGSGISGQIWFPGEHLCHGTVGANQMISGYVCSNAQAEGQFMAGNDGCGDLRHNDMPVNTGGYGGNPWKYWSPVSGTLGNGDIINFIPGCN